FERINKKIEIFKKEKHSQVDSQAGSKQQFSVLAIFRSKNFIAYNKISQRTDDNKDKETPIPPSIKNIAAN
ncbi:MAG TPA: hypothetical protein VLA03_09990, partial [Draconibacterium sp.]|nr:hypothetical protein [Draconibacterium sp.]